MRGFLQHVLPRGFQKVRYYGWMSPHNKVGLDSVRWLVWLFLGWTYWLGSGHAPQQEPQLRERVRELRQASAARPDPRVTTPPTNRGPCLPASTPLLKPSASGQKRFP